MASDAELVRKACHATAGAVGGCYWPECKCAPPELLAALLDAERERCAALAYSLQPPHWDATGDRLSGLLHGFDSAQGTIAAAIRGGSHGE